MIQPRTALILLGVWSAVMSVGGLAMALGGRALPSGVLFAVLGLTGGAAMVLRALNPDVRTGSVGTGKDITGQERAEAALRESEERYGQLFNQLIEGFCIIEVLFDADQAPIDYRFLEINPAFEAQTGLCDARGKRMLELAPEHEAHWFRIYGKVALTGEPVRFVNEARALNRWYEVSAYRVGGADSRKVAILFNDITDAKRAEQALRESEGRFHSLADAIPLLCWVANGDGWITWYNLRWYEYTGTTPEQMEGWGWQSVHDPEVLPQVLERWRASIASGRPFEMVFPLRGADGRFRPFLTRVVPVRGEDGQVCRWFGSNTDISEPMRLEEERHKVDERMVQAQKLESLGVLVAGVAHNFNNILAIILGTASIQEQEVTDPGQLEALRVIGAACQRGRSLVQSLAHFSRPALARRIPVEVNALVEEVRVLLENTSRNRIEIRAALTGDLTWINGDPGSLSSALMNICLNGLDAMPDGGTLTLRTAIPRPDRVEVSVEDTGAGMAPEILARVTEPFYTTKPVGQGTGLGLSITHGVLKAHGGTLEIASQAGKGTQVRLGLPRVPGPVPEAAVPAPPPPLEVLKILLVDDDEEVRFLMTRMLRRAGAAEVATAPGGREAIDCLGSGAVPDLVILDQNMPGLDGLQTLALIRERHPDLPVLISSGQPDIEDWEALKRQNVAVISKPFTLEEIREKLAGMPGAGRSRL